MNITI